MSRCKGCNAEILWAVTEANGRSIPLDLEPTPDGNVVMTGAHGTTIFGGQAPACRTEAAPTLFDDGTPRYMPHHATCPKVEEFRK